MLEQLNIFAIINKSKVRDRSRGRPEGSLFNNYYTFGLLGRVFANGPGDMDSIPGRVIPKTLKMILDVSLLNTQQYKVRIKGKVEQSRERSSALLYTSV